MPSDWSSVGSRGAMGRWEYLDQDKMWVDGTGRVLRLENIDPEHRKNLIIWLYRNAPWLQMWHTHMTIQREAIKDMDARERREFMRRYGGSIGVAAATVRLEQSPEEFIACRPLVKRLLELEVQDAQERCLFPESR